MQLHITGLPANGTREEIWDLFATYGEVDKVNLFLEVRGTMIANYGFVTMHVDKEAEAAMRGLDGFPMTNNIRLRVRPARNNKAQQQCLTHE